MNQQIYKSIKAGIFAAALAAIIEMIISASMTKYLGQNIDSVALVLGGLTTGLVTLILTIIISTVIARSKQKV